jgi:hypothetical protein
VKEKELLVIQTNLNYNIFANTGVFG